MNGQHDITNMKDVLEQRKKEGRSIEILDSEAPGKKLTSMTKADALYELFQIGEHKKGLEDGRLGIFERSLSPWYRRGYEQGMTQNKVRSSF